MSKSAGRKIREVPNTGRRRFVGIRRPPVAFAILVLAFVARLAGAAEAPGLYQDVLGEAPYLIDVPPTGTAVSSYSPMDTRARGPARVSCTANRSMPT